jgi:hypothetical protein
LQFIRCVEAEAAPVQLDLGIGRGWAHQRALGARRGRGIDGWLALVRVGRLRIRRGALRLFGVVRHRPE